MTTSRSKKLPKTIADRLQHLSQLQENWDGYGGAAISSKAVEETKSVLRKALSLSGNKFPNPSVSPTPEGGIGLEWNLHSGKELFLEISPERKLSYLLVIPNSAGGEEEYEEDIESKEELDKILGILSE